MIIWAFFYFLIQGIPISFWFIFRNISVYYIFILNVFDFSSLFIYTNIIYLIQIFSVCIIQFLIQTIFNHRRGWFFWAFIYYLFIGIWVFYISFSVISLWNTYLFLVSIEISLTSSVILYHFSKLYILWYYTNVNNLNNPTSQLDMCHLVIHVLPHIPPS